MKGVHKPIISDELFARCQKVRALRQRTVDTKLYTRHTYLLSGIITCKTCEKKMRAQNAKSGDITVTLRGSLDFTACFLA